MAFYETDETKRIMSRVQKLLRLANDAGAAEGERDNAMRAVHAILAKYNLDLASIESVDSASGADTGSAVEPRIDHAAEFIGYPWARNICQSIGNLFFCRYLYSTLRGGAGGKCRHYFIGRTSNAITAALVAEFVVKAVFREGAKLQRMQHENTAFHRSFAWGAANKIRARVNELKIDRKQVEQPTTATTTGTALVLASLYDTESKANDQYVLERWKKLGHGGRGGKGADHGVAYQQGQAYGATVSLNPQLS